MDGGKEEGRENIICLEMGGKDEYQYQSWEGRLSLRNYIRMSRHQVLNAYRLEELMLRQLIETLTREVIGDATFKRSIDLVTGSFDYGESIFAVRTS